MKALIMLLSLCLVACGGGGSSEAVGTDQASESENSTDSGTAESLKWDESLWGSDWG